MASRKSHRDCLSPIVEQQLSTGRLDIAVEREILAASKSKLKAIEAEDDLGIINEEDSGLSTVKPVKKTM